MQYKKGEFITFRTITKIHLGAISENLMEGEEIEFDGFTLRRGGDTHAMHSLRGAVKAGWLVSQANTTAKYVPQPAGVVVHRANGLDDSVIDLNMDVDQDDVNLGTLQEVRPDNAPLTHKATKAGEQHMSANASEGQVVARFKTSAKQGTVTVGKNDRQVVNALDNQSAVEVEKIARAVATGDVEEAIGGESLEELLPHAASTGRPEAGVLLDGERVKTAASSDLATIQQFIPGFGWDTSIQWAKRAKFAVEKYGHIPVVLNYILSVETDAVKREINKRIVV